MRVIDILLIGAILLCVAGAAKPDSKVEDAINQTGVQVTAAKHDLGKIEGGKYRNVMGVGEAVIITAGKTDTYGLCIGIAFIDPSTYRVTKEIGYIDEDEIPAVLEALKALETAKADTQLITRGGIYFLSGNGVRQIKIGSGGTAFELKDGKAVQGLEAKIKVGADWLLAQKRR